MIESLGGATSSLVKLALDAAVLRHQVIANNIANANTPDFKPQYVAFEEYLGRAAREMPSAQSDLRLESELKTLRQRLDSGLLVNTDINSAKVELDQEIARLSANVVRYQALLAGLSKRGDLVKMAITGQGR